MSCQSSFNATSSADLTDRTRPTRASCGTNPKASPAHRYGEKYRAIDAAVGKQGLYITVLLRLSPLIPFGVNNYLCGCTQIRLWQWVLGTWVGVLPGTTAYCNLGAIGKEVRLAVSM